MYVATNYFWDREFGMVLWGWGVVGLDLDASSPNHGNRSTRCRCLHCCCGAAQRDIPGLIFHLDKAIAEAVRIALVDNAALAHEDGLVAIIEFVEAVCDPECSDAA